MRFIVDYIHVDSTHRLMKIAFFGRQLQEKDLRVMETLISDLFSYGHELLLHTSLYSKLLPYVPTSYGVGSFQTQRDLQGCCNMLFSIGGDGTLLDSVSVLGNSEIPVLGINTGHLGFLTGLNRSGIEGLMADLTQGKYHVEPRSLLKIESKENFFGEENYALNESSIQCGTRKEIISISIFVNDIFMATCSADGILVATPTGSTAYCLSCGGPILQPDSACFVIVPINSHTLMFRPIIVPDTARIRLVVEDSTQQIVVTADAKHVEATPKTEIILSKEDFCVNLVKLQGTDFYSAMREKLMWGTDLRQQTSNSQKQ